MIINIDELRYLQDNAKILKSSYIFIDGNNIYGSDEELVFLKQVSFINTTNIQFLCICYKDFVSFIKNIDMGDEIIIENNIIFSSSNNIVYCNNINSIERFHNMIRSINICINTDILYHEDNMKEQNDFNNIISGKSSDGISIINRNNHLLSLYSNMLPIVKSDIVEMNIFDYGLGRILAHYIIHKKKNLILNVFVPYRTL